MEADPPPVVDPDAPRRAALASLIVFLDNRDESCPRCGYSLRGIRHDHCPECGWVITLRPSDGVDRRLVVRLARCVALIGLIFAGANLLEFGALMLAFGGMMGRMSILMVFQLAYVLLLVLSVSSLLRFRRASEINTHRLVVMARRHALAITITFGIIVLVPFLLQMLSFALGAWMD